MKQRTSPTDIRERAGLVGGLINQGRLAWRLLRDSRVPGWVKMIPLGGLLYMLSPIDLLPDWVLPGLGAVDDVGLLLIAMKAFVDLSPAGVVREHMEQLFGRVREPEDEPPSRYIDAPYRVVEEDRESIRE